MEPGVQNYFNCNHTNGWHVAAQLYILVWSPYWSCNCFAHKSFLSYWAKLLVLWLAKEAKFPKMYENLGQLATLPGILEQHFIRSVHTMWSMAQLWNFMKCHAQKNVVTTKKHTFDRSPFLVDYIANLFHAQPDTFSWLTVLCTCVFWACLFMCFAVLRQNVWYGSICFSNRWKMRLVHQDQKQGKARRSYQASVSSMVTIWWRENLIIQWRTI